MSVLATVEAVNLLVELTQTLVNAASAVQAVGAIVAKVQARDGIYTQEDWNALDALTDTSRAHVVAALAKLPPPLEAGGQ